jgi:hypothetical protein
MVDGLITMHQGRFTQTGVDLIMGTGSFTAPKILAVQTTDGTNRSLTATSPIACHPDRRRSRSGEIPFVKKPRQHIPATRPTLRHKPVIPTETGGKLPRTISVHELHRHRPHRLFPRLRLRCRLRPCRHVLHLLRRLPRRRPRLSSPRSATALPRSPRESHSPHHRGLSHPSSNARL